MRDALLYGMATRNARDVQARIATSQHLQRDATALEVQHQERGMRRRPPDAKVNVANDNATVELNEITLVELKGIVAPLFVLA